MKTKIILILTMVLVLAFGTISYAFADADLLACGIEEAEALKVGEIGVYNQFNFAEKYLTSYYTGRATDRNWSTANVRLFLNYLVSGGEFEERDKKFEILDISVWPFINEWSEGSVVQFPMYTITYQRIQ